MTYFPPGEDEDEVEMAVGWVLGLLFSLVVAVLVWELLFRVWTWVRS